MTAGTTNSWIKNRALGGSTGGNKGSSGREEFPVGPGFASESGELDDIVLGGRKEITWQKFGWLGRLPEPPRVSCRLRPDEYRPPTLWLFEMLLLNHTLPSPAENLALDEALLEMAEAGGLSDGVLRIWESPTYFVVLGRSSKAEIEINLETCRREGVPIYRRPSGGGTVISGPGCISYAAVLDFESLPHLRAIDEAHQYVLGRVCAALTTLVPNIARAGTSDLALVSGNGEHRKISGNALRMKRDHFLYHGTLLYDLSLEMVERLLATPTRTPDYREGRSHAEFITNLPLDRQAIESALADEWNAQESFTDAPLERTTELADEKYNELPNPLPQK